MANTRALHVLLAIPDKPVCTEIAEYFRKRGIHPQVVETAKKLHAALKTLPPDLLLFETSTGQDIPAAREFPELTVVALARPDRETWFQAARAGAEVVLALPLDAQDYPGRLDTVCTRVQAKLAALGAEAMHAPILFATSEEMAEVRDLIEKVAPTSATVLLKGESGVGKELAAQLIHSSSLRSERPFVKVNCAAIPNELLESELFGYEAGAFTGAAKAKPGKFELADGGTIFLDEIAELHPVLQAKLLHVLQDGEFARLGAKSDTAVDVRVICATNKMLDVLVANGLFREDLFYRINVVAVSLPPLRSRTREIPGLVDFFLSRYAATYNKPLVPIDSSSMQSLIDYDWPGNIRELENLCKRYVIVGGIEQILRELELRKSGRSQEPLENRDVGTVPMAGESPQNSTPTLLEIGRKAAWAAERAAIATALETTQWNRREAAALLGVSYKALLNKIGRMRGEVEYSKEVLK